MPEAAGAEGVGLVRVPVVDEVRPGRAAMPQDGEPAPAPAAAVAERGRSPGSSRRRSGSWARVPRRTGRGAGRGGAPPTAAGPGGAPRAAAWRHWPGDGSIAPRILFTVGQRLVAITAANGELDTAFRERRLRRHGVAWGGVPLVFKHIVIVGSNNGEVTQGPSPGDTKAFDARTGKQLWTFKSVAQPGDKNHSTWLDEGWKNRQGVNHWGWYFTLDEQREILYTVFGSPAGNYWGGDRPGANLYGNSVVAVDVNTGKYLWHFQSVHHDLWDSDQPSPPTLMDVTRNGRRQYRRSD